MRERRSWLASVDNFTIVYFSVLAGAAITAMAHAEYPTRKTALTAPLMFLMSGSSAGIIGIVLRHISNTAF